MALTDQQLADLRDLHADGCGRNEIARRIDAAPVMVSRAAERLGLTFDRSQMQAATAARLADLAELRSLLAMDLTHDAIRLRDQMWQPTTVYSFGGKENIYNDHTFNEAPAAEKRALMGTAGMAIDRSLKLAPAEASSNLDAAKSMLGNLGVALTEFVRTEDEQAEQSSDDGGV